MPVTDVVAGFYSSKSLPCGDVLEVFILYTWFKRWGNSNFRGEI